jgi:MFS family permease
VIKAVLVIGSGYSERIGENRRMKSRAALVAFIAGLAYVFAIMQRSSLGVAAILATSRFHTNASQLGALSVVQLALYAGMQIPVGILLDRFGPKKLLIVGSLAMAGGQAVLATASDLGLALVGRGLVGFGDAFTFITMIRLVNAWYTGSRAARIQQLLSNFGQLGQVISAVPFAALLGVAGWTPAFGILSGASLGLAVLVLAFVSDAPQGSTHQRHANIKSVLAGLAQSLKLPAVRLGFWTHFAAQSAGTVFILAWGVPYVVSGLGYSHALASSFLLIFVGMSVCYGPFVGWFCAKFPQWRVRLVSASVASVLFAVVLQIVYPGVMPAWLLAGLLVLVATGGPTSMIAFDFSRAHVARESLGAANGFINVGGFIASLTMMALIGFGIDIQQKLDCSNSACGLLFSLEHFRVAFIAEISVVGFGLVMLLRARNRLAKAE